MKSFIKVFLIVLLATSVAHASEQNNCPNGNQRLTSPDKSWYACPVSQDGKFSFSINGKPGPAYDWTGFPDFSPDSTKLAYKARIGNEWFVVTGNRNGQQEKGKSYSEIEAVIWKLDYPVIKFSVFGPQGTLAYSARQDKNWYVVADNHESPAYEWSRPILFSPDGSQFGYKAKLNGKWFVVIGDKPGKHYDWVSIPIFSPDSKQFAYKAELNNKWFVVIGDKEGKTYDSVSFPSWSPDAKEVAYQAKSGKTWSVVVGDTVGKAYDAVASLSDNNDYRDFGMLTFTADTKEVQYAVFKGGEWIVVTGENEGAEYIPKSGPKAAEQYTGNVSGVTPIAEFQNANGQLRSLASRIETRLDKLAEEQGFEDMDLWTRLADARLSIHVSEENVLAAQKGSLKENLTLAKKNTISAQEKLINIINDVKQK